MGEVIAHLAMSLTIFNSRGYLVWPSGAWWVMPEV